MYDVGVYRGRFAVRDRDDPFGFKRVGQRLRRCAVLCPVIWMHVHDDICDYRETDRQHWSFPVCLTATCPRHLDPSG
jgi:hypothetical protein